MAKMNDPELHAMNAIRGAMEPLTDDQVRRVKLWILDRYGDHGDPKADPAPQPPEKEPAP
jgi:hypothetical protein